MRRTDRGQTFHNPGSKQNGIVGVGSPPLSFVPGRGSWWNGGDSTSAPSADLNYPTTHLELQPAVASFDLHIRSSFVNNSVHGSAPECFFSGLGKYPHLISGISLSDLPIPKKTIGWRVENGVVACAASLRHNNSISRWTLGLWTKRSFNMSCLHALALRSGVTPG